MRAPIRIALLAGVLALVLVPSQASASVDIHIDIAGIPGESTADGFENTIDVLAFSWAVSKSKDKPPNFGDVSLTKYVDRASPLLFGSVASGATIASAKLNVRKGGAEPYSFLRFCFTGVRITSVSGGGSHGEDRLTENVSFAYQTVVESYTRQAATGQPGDVFFKGWDLSKNLLYGAECAA